MISYTYRDESNTRYFRIKPPSSAEESFSVHEIISDLLFNGASQTVTTHLYMQTDLFKSEEDYDINAYWDLIWDNVIPFIEEGRE